MKTPHSPHFVPIDISSHFNAGRRTDGFRMRPGDADWVGDLRGHQSFRGIPFILGDRTGSDVLLLRPGEVPVEVALPRVKATYVVFLQAVEDLRPPKLKGFEDVGPATLPVEGNDLGDRVSTYVFVYDDGTESEVPILRRFAIQQKHASWGASPFAAVPALGPHVYTNHAENVALSRRSVVSYMDGEARTGSGRLRQGENLWLYAMPNPEPQKVVVGVRLRSETEASQVFGMATTEIRTHPLRPHVRRKLKLRLPNGIRLNALGELDTDERGDQIGIDLGVVISARAVLEYPHADWLGDSPVIRPNRSETEVIIEYSAHPDARIYFRTEDGNLLEQELRTLEASTAGSAELATIQIPAASRPVRLRIVEKKTGEPVAARLHVHGPNGEYLPPSGHHRKVNAEFFEDYAAEYLDGLNQYAYVGGSCEINLPLGLVYFEITRGFEFKPLRAVVEIKPSTESLTFELENVLRWREQGWVTADTHVHYISPQTALLEGNAEGVNVVNLLATQWGEMFSNVGDFDGRTTLGAKDFGGAGEFLVRVGTENRMQVLGHISLLGYTGEMIGPLCTGGPDESALGDVLETTMADWARRCQEQGGLVVLPHAPNPQAERAADIVLGLVDAVEMMVYNPRTAHISAYGLVDWYRYLNIGYQLPLVGGSDKMSAFALLGGIRTYVQLGAREFTYQNWMDAVRCGDTFISVGPLVRMTVEGVAPGGTIVLPASGGKLTVAWQVESASVRPTLVEVIRNGDVVHEARSEDLTCKGYVEIQTNTSCWFAVRVRGSSAGRAVDIAAHTSAVFARVGDDPIFAPADAAAVLSQIEGTIAYVDTLAPRSDEAHHSKLRATLEFAHHRLHQKLHKMGASHSHTPVHSLHVNREH